MLFRITTLMTNAYKEHPVHLEQLTWLLTRRALLYKRAQYHNDASAVNEGSRDLLRCQLTLRTYIFSLLVKIIKLNFS